jgi:hypothetical protein
MGWIKNKLTRVDPEVSGAFNPVYLDRIALQCPQCQIGGMWAVPDGFKIAIAGRLLLQCGKGHTWSISGAWAEEKELKHDDR